MFLVVEGDEEFSEFLIGILVTGTDHVLCVGS
jgi:hypothetical protein